MRALHRVIDHRAELLRHAGIGQRLGEVILVAEDEMQREHAGLRRQRRGVRGRGDDEVDVAGAQLLQHHRLLAQLRAGELVDAHLAAAQFHELGVEDVAGDAVSGRVRLIVAEGKLALSIGVGGHGKRHDTNGHSRRRELSDRRSHW